MAKPKTCRECGETVIFRAWYRHAQTGKIIRASHYGLRAFRFCGCV
jgi:hypothetical protein